VLYFGFHFDRGVSPDPLQQTSHYPIRELRETWSQTFGLDLVKGIDTVHQLSIVVTSAINYSIGAESKMSCIV